MTTFTLTPELLLLIGFLALGLMLMVARRGVYNRITRPLMDILMAAVVAFGSAILMLVLG